MKKAFSLMIAFCCIACYCSCKGAEDTGAASRTRPGIPANAKFADENKYYEVYINEEVAPKNEFDVAQVSVWLYYKSAKQSVKLLTTAPPKGFRWYQPDGTEGFDFPIDSISAIHKVIPVDLSTLIVEGCPDVRNLYSYIIDIPNRKATYIPCNAGIVGFTSEEGLIIGQSYRYSSDPEVAGRYSCIQIFDWDGNQVADLDLEREHMKGGPMNFYFDFQPRTKLTLKSYDSNCDYRFPVEGKQSCWEYVYTFDSFAPEDVATLNQLVATDKEWSKVENGYKFTHIETDDPFNAEGFFDLKNNQFIFIHGTIIDED